MRILITGATGLIGQEIVRKCRDRKIAVNYLTTDKSKIKSEENYKGFYWNTNELEIDKSCFNEVEAIINLAGSNIAKRWTKSYKDEIISSRINSLRTLRKGLAESNKTVKSIVSSSAIGIYPDSYVKYYQEDETEIDDSFLGVVVEKWEDTAKELDSFTEDLAIIRTGLVLSDHGGALPKMIGPVENYIGSALGNGQQWQSWIHISDLAEMYLFLIENQVSGVFNGVAPNPVTNEKLIRSIAEIVQKPILFPKVPKFVLKVVLGEMSKVVLASHRVSSKKIQEEGFNFNYTILSAALEDLIL